MNGEEKFHINDDDDGGDGTIKFYWHLFGTFGDNRNDNPSIVAVVVTAASDDDQKPKQKQNRRAC